MLLGSLLAGLAFSNAGTAAAHALAYPIGGLVKSPHGEVTGLLLPYVMEYNTSVVPEKMAKIALAFGIGAEGKSQRELALAASGCVLNLVQEIGLPVKLSQIGISENDIPGIAENALPIVRLVRNNPRVPGQEGFESILSKAF